MGKRTGVWLLLAVGGLVLFGRFLRGQEARLRPGDPLPGITGAEAQRFRTGLEAFTDVLEPELGLGPVFNGTSCAGCHSIPAVGGSGTLTVVRAGMRDQDGKFHVLPGGTLFQMFSIPDFACQVQIPAEANVIARRITTPTFGLGLVEAIPDDTLLALEDPDDRDQDGIRGRAAVITDIASGGRRIGRFGWKAQHATLLAFAADAYRNEMGITNDLFPEEAGPGIDPEQLKKCDLAPDPEDIRDRRTGLRTIDRLEAFLKYLAPVGRGPINDAVLAGEALFGVIGCASCHRPVLTTGPSPNPVFDRRPVPLYSDLLLHDLHAGDGIEQAAASASEIRTPPLWGLRFRRPLWHDGSVATLEEAIRRHGGESEAVRQNYLGLGSEQRSALLAFLMSL